MDTIEQHSWEPLPWQDYVNEILHQHFCLLGHTYQRVADGVNGDGGLEGFSSNGAAYQAYADQNSNSKAERLKKIKDKISEDLPKLIKYKSEWTSRLGDIKLKSWTLVIPLYEDKDLITHALRKAKLVREANLPFIAKKFRAYVTDINGFPAAVNQITNSSGIKVNLDAQEVSKEVLHTYESEKPKDIITIDRKLAQVATLKQEEKRIDCRRDYLKRYLHRENLLEILRRRHPPLREKVDELLAAKGKDIVTDSRLDTTPPNLRLREVRDALQIELAEYARGLSSNNYSDIAYGTIGHWLINCNLQFNEESRP